MDVPAATPGGLSGAERAALRGIAREALRAHLLGGEPSVPSPDSWPPTLRSPRGAFVTLTHGGELRGCLGRLRPAESLGEVVRAMAVSAASDDPRFPPVAPDEWAEIGIEISVLAPFERIGGPGEVRPGDGLYVVSGPRTGLLLPQVAERTGWGPVRFLEETCRKAGLPGNAWRDRGTELYRFTAEVFGDEPPRPAGSP
ncbi:MAG: AmmeMemoRadiSam system protein A [Planctomycetales bacterium]|nr:AmmeMemoRadiSam system protein A [Planctomycetales bacterium]